ncbi:hypothetical protein BKA67DRAFT_572233 [Truncatella angustata]|uniref:Uncharacterized protein n=1 Tax=Truncatella angustata TaxID=152316 RepID=A0A9P8UGP9_9PEZI|nr:uncharacterized protein BKA67DRAFT_572233 [Truncatella angustata]KAH6651866.1 hypothetical protein BKA67DRAFT_572233 [Truncatella angustata]
MKHPPQVFKEVLFLFNFFFFFFAKAWSSCSSSLASIHCLLLFTATLQSSAIYSQRMPWQFQLHHKNQLGSANEHKTA